MQGLSFILLRAVGVNDSQLLQLLQPFNGNYPTKDAWYANLQQVLTRMTHILEHHPGTISQMLNQGMHTRAFLMDDGIQDAASA